ncbi:hypothetical protein KAH55_06465, partial [bacterium]|nr:hypothetical protein [bacterium]
PILCVLLLSACEKSSETVPETPLTQQPIERLILDDAALSAGAHHTNHAEIFGKYVTDFNNNINREILAGIDSVQQHALDGGTYFIGIRANPPESPVFYQLQLFGQPLLEVPRQSSYCSGSTYSAFIEAMNIHFPNGKTRLSAERFEALRMQEPNGARREDGIKFWGHWNADGFGNHFALVQYSGMGETITPKTARPGDFLNISWKNGGGHSVIFLGWAIQDGDKKLVYWSSQTGTNGYGDQIVSVNRIATVKIVRLTHPEKLFTFDYATPVTNSVPGDTITW